MQPGFSRGNVYYGSAYYKYIGNAIDIVPEEHHRYASGYMNVTYTYDNRYNAFASFRKDYADLFGQMPSSGVSLCGR